MPSFSAGVAPPSGVLQSSGYQYPLPHGGGGVVGGVGGVGGVGAVGGQQPTFILPQLVQQGMTFYGHYSILLSDEIHVNF